MGGRALRVGGKLTKDVAGYDLVRLLVGSEGTLAVLTEITLKLLPAPEAKATGAAYFRDLEASARSVSRIIENAHPARDARVPRPGDDARRRRERRPRAARRTPARC